MTSVIGKPMTAQPGSRTQNVRRSSVAIRRQMMKVLAIPGSRSTVPRSSGATMQMQIEAPWRFVMKAYRAAKMPQASTDLRSSPALKRP